MKTYFQDNINNLPLYIGIILVLEIVNIYYLPMVVPKWSCGFITIILAGVLVGYSVIMFTYVLEKYKAYMKKRRIALYNKIHDLEMHFDEVISEQNMLNMSAKSEILQALEDCADNIKATQKLIEDKSVTNNAHIDQLKENIIHELGAAKEIILDAEENNKLMVELVDNKFERQFKELILASTENTKSQLDYIKTGSEVLAGKIEESLDVTLTCINNVSDVLLTVQEGLVENNNACKDAVVTKIDVSNKANNTLVEESCNTILELIKTRFDEMIEADVTRDDSMNSALLAIKKDLLGNNEIGVTTIQKELLGLREEQQAMFKDSNALIKEKQDGIVISIDDFKSYYKESSDDLSKLMETIDYKISEENMSDRIAILEAIDSVKEVYNDNLKQQTMHIDDSITVLNTTVVETGASIIGDIEISRRTFATELDETNLLISEKIQNVTDVISEVAKGISGGIELNATVLENVNETIRSINEEIVAILDSLVEKTDQVSIEVLGRLKEIVEKQEEQGEISRNRYKKQNEELKELIDIIGEQSEKLEELFDEQQGVFDSNTEKLITKYEEYEVSVGDYNKKLESLTSIMNQFNNSVSTRFDSLQHQIVHLNILKKMIEELPVIIKSGSPLKKNPTRVEKIVDEKAGITVQNHYDNNRLKKGVMFKNGSKAYEFEYSDTGKIARTKHYDEKGTILAESTYHENGQVRERRDTVIKNGQKQTVISKFDKDGNKIS